MNKLNLKRDIVFFDIEATGLNILKDRIIQIALIKLHKGDAHREELTFMVNPGVPISEDAIAVHGITPDMVRNKPTFDKVAPEIFDFIKDADLAGYNSDRYDIPMLLEELHRAGFELDLNTRNCLDVQKIFYKMEPRTLKAAYKLYCDKDLEDAHDALADVKATVEVFFGQLDRYDGVEYIDGDGYNHGAPIVPDIEEITKFISDERTVDVTNRLKYDINGDVVFNFGKHLGKKVLDVIVADRSYYHWILEKDFSVQVKQTIRSIMEAYEKDKKA